jgi:peptide/nickel transport system permease protein
MMHLLPGDATTMMLRAVSASGTQQIELRHNLGLDRPLFVQYVDYIGQATRGDFGRSLFSHQKVTDEILSQLPATLELAAAAMLISTVSGISIGIASAIHHRSLLDRVFTVCSLIGLSMPSFWLGTMLILLFSLKLGWLPAFGTGSIQQLILPTIALSLGQIAVTARLMRTSMLEVLYQDYVVTARAKGLGSSVVIGRHVLRNALIPMVTLLGIQFSGLLSGAVITETVFGRQGIGQLIVEAIQRRDLPLVQGVVIFVGAVTIVSNLFVDLLYPVIDPRI